MLSRRTLIGRAAVGAAAALTLGGVARVGVAATRALDGTPDEPAHDATNGATDAFAHDRTEPSADAEAAPVAVEPAPPSGVQAVAAPAPWELVRPLAAGAVLAHGWQLVDLGPIQNGSCVATLRNARGRSHRVHLCRNDGTPQGLVYTRRVDFVVMNEGQGDLPTEERLAQAVAVLAHTVAANEARVSRAVFAELLPHRERVQRFAAAQGATAAGKLR